MPPPAPVTVLLDILEGIAVVSMLRTYMLYSSILFNPTNFGAKWSNVVALQSANDLHTCIIWLSSNSIKLILKLYNAHT